MHEMSLLRDLLAKIEEIARAEDASAVTHVKVKLGALSHISAEHFREHWDEAIEGHVAETADLEVEELTDETDPLAQEIVLESLEVES